MRHQSPVRKAPSGDLGQWVARAVAERGLNQSRLHSDVHIQARHAHTHPLSRKEFRAAVGRVTVETPTGNLVVAKRSHSVIPVNGKVGVLTE